MPNTVKEKNMKKTNQKIKENKVKKEKLTNEEIIIQLQKELEDQKKHFLRSLADLDNDRKRFDSSKKDFIKFSNGNLLSELIDILDNFNSAMNMKNPTPEVKNFLFGFQIISDQFATLLNSNNVIIIPVKPGDDFNSETHSSVEEVESSEFKKGKVVSVLKEGYELHGRLLRPAMVKTTK